MPDNPFTMRFGPKLAVLLTLAAVTPLALALGRALPEAKSAARMQVREANTRTAELLAREASAAVLEKIQTLAVWATALQLGNLESREARTHALRLVYRQTPATNVVGLFDGNGEPLVDEVAHEAEATADREGMGPRELALYARHAPFQAALEEGAAVGPVYVLPDARGRPVPRLVLAVAVPADVPGQRWVLAAEFSLRYLSERLANVAVGNGGRAQLVDAQGRLIAHPDRSRLGTLFKEEAPDSEPDWLTSSADVPLTGWRMHVGQSASEALRPLHRALGRAVWWGAAGLAFALLFGLLASRDSIGRLRRVRSAMHRVTGGDLEVEVPAHGGDEAAALGRSFNELVLSLRERARARTEPASTGAAEEAASQAQQEASASLERGAALADLTVLSLEIRASTSISERLSAAETVQLLKLYFDQAARVASRHGGTLTPSAGNGMLVLYGADGGDAGAGAVQAAVRAGLDIQRRIESFNASRREAGVECLSFGIGICSGRVLRCDGVLFGDAVNVAQQLQTHAGNGNVLISGETRTRMGPKIDAAPCGQLHVKGREQRVDVYAALYRKRSTASRALV